jgi:hypothetical protein
MEVLRGLSPGGKDDEMKLWNRTLVVILFVLPMLIALPGWPQTKTEKGENNATASPGTNDQHKNMDVYIALLRRNVRQEKAEMMGAMMVLSAEDSAKFWAIYSDYDAELTKLNDQRVANIKEYARTYTQMTDEEADKLIQNSLSYRKQRSELFAKTYDRVKQSLGGMTAARFAMVEDQLLLLIDLQIVSSLPVVGQSK